MADIKIKRSSVPGKIPGTADLALGELAINTYDGKLFLKKNNGTDSVIEVAASTGGGGNASVTASDTAPTTPNDSALWWDSATGLLKIYYNDGTSSQWVDAFNVPTAGGSGGSGGVSVTVADVAPTTPTDNSLWWDSSIGKMFLYYNDGTSSQWVGITNSPGKDGIGLPQGGSVGQALLKNTGLDYDTGWANIVPYSDSAVVAGSFNSGIVNPTNTNRLNYEGDLYATNFVGNVNASNIFATGTKDVTTFLCGDNAWVIPPGVVSVKETIYSTATSGTFTADPKTLFTQVTVTGGGGGGGGSDWTSGFGAAGGGGAGGTAIAWYTPAEVGSTAAYTVGAGGSAGAAASGASGGTGSSSLFNPNGTGLTLTGTGGIGGQGTGNLANTVSVVFTGGSGSGTINAQFSCNGGHGKDGLGISATFLVGGEGGSSFWGCGGQARVLTTTGATAGATVSSSPGSGGGGAVNNSSTAGVAGGVGQPGRIFIVEYLGA